MLFKQHLVVCPRDFKAIAKVCAILLSFSPPHLVRVVELVAASSGQLLLLSQARKVELLNGVEVIVSNLLLSTGEAHCNVELTLTAFNWASGFATVVEGPLCAKILDIHIISEHLLYILLVIGNLWALIRLGRVDLRSQP